MVLSSKESGGYDVYSSSGKGEDALFQQAIVGLRQAYISVLKVKSIDEKAA